MSHQPERSEKDCLNCGTQVAGRFCQHCGQENVIGHMPFFALIRHFIYDIFHFDGKFFETLKFLFFKPGFVPLQYVQGRRLSFLDPIRMYLFTSAVFFIVFFATANIDKDVNITGEKELTKAERFSVAARYNKDSVRHQNPEVNPLSVLLDTSYVIVTDSKRKNFPYDSVYTIRWQENGHEYGARKIEKERRGRSSSAWIDKNLASIWDRYNKQYDGDVNAMFVGFIDKLMHRFSYLLFLSLPFFAAILKLLYLRRKRFFYFDHAVFTLYHYIFSFILLLLIIGVDALNDRLNWDLLGYVLFLLVISWPVHLFIAMKRFYQQGRGRTFVKFVLLNSMAGLVLLLLFFCFILYSAYSI